MYDGGVRGKRVNNLRSAFPPRRIRPGGSAGKSAPFKAADLAADDPGPGSMTCRSTADAEIIEPQPRLENDPISREGIQFINLC